MLDTRCGCWFWGEGPGGERAKGQTKHHVPPQGSCHSLRRRVNLKVMGMTQPAPHPYPTPPAGVTSPVQVQHLEIHRTTLADGSRARGVFFQVHGMAHMTLGSWQRPTRVMIWLRSAFHPTSVDLSRARVPGARGFGRSESTREKIPELQRKNTDRPPKWPEFVFFVT